MVSFNGHEENGKSVFYKGGNIKTTRAFLSI